MILALFAGIGDLFLVLTLEKPPFAGREPLIVKIYIHKLPIHRIHAAGSGKALIAGDHPGPPTASGGPGLQNRRVLNKALIAGDHSAAALAAWAKWLPLPFFIRWSMFFM